MKALKDLNLPNKLTVLRVFLVPLMAGLCYLPGAAGSWAPGIVFALAALTDYLDGRIARSRGLITDFGKFLDPVADKVLVLAAFVMLVRTGQMPAWAAVLVLARELAVDGLRLAAVRKGSVIAAGWLGKVKTCSQMALILLLFFTGWKVTEHWYTIVLCAWVCIITLWSGVDYFVKNRNALEEESAP